MNVISQLADLTRGFLCWDPYKRPLNRPKFSETVTVSALAGQLYGGRPFGRPTWRPNFWTAKINGQKYT
ncbi:hypothetical protein BpHYR1_046556, partial [Brachionus plicatilis]